MGVNGTYVLERSENLEPFLKAIGIPDDRIAKLAAAKPTMTLDLSGNKLTITSKSHVETTNVLTLGTPSPYKFAMGVELQINLNLSGTKGNGTFKLGDKEGKIEVDSTDSHFTEDFSIGGQSLKRVYKRT